MHRFCVMMTSLFCQLQCQLHLIGQSDLKCHTTTSLHFRCITPCTCHLWTVDSIRRVNRTDTNSGGTRSYQVYTIVHSTSSTRYNTHARPSRTFHPHTKCQNARTWLEEETAASRRRRFDGRKPFPLRHIQYATLMYDIQTTNILQAYMNS